MAREKDYLCGLAGDVNPDMIRVYNSMLEQKIKKRKKQDALIEEFIIDHYYKIVLILSIIITISVIMNFDFIVNMWFIWIFSLKQLGIIIGVFFKDIF